MPATYYIVKSSLLARSIQNDIDEYVVDHVRRDLDEQQLTVDDDALIAFRRCRQGVPQIVRQVSLGDARRQRLTALQILRDTWRQAFILVLAVSRM